jgi:glycosyltransferase involved in cell wall biosynthesis
MRNKPLVSVITIFLNAEDFIEEAIGSVLGQTYQNWELLLIDDGSTDASTEIAKRSADLYPGQIRYLEHSGHQNHGKGASRNLGIGNAQGKYVAFLDADDIYLPNKLADQVTILESYPKADVLYGNTKYWFSWTNQRSDIEQDFLPNLGVQENRLIQPPTLLPRFLRGNAAVPCTCSLIVKSRTLSETGGFVEDFQGQDIYEDQVFYAKIFLNSTTYVSERCWDLYRQHAGSSMTKALETGQDYIARRFYLNWLEDYLKEHGIADKEVWIALRKEKWLNRHYHFPRNHPWTRRTDSMVRWLKKWLLRFEDQVLPSSISYRLWKVAPSKRISSGTG